MHKRYGAGGWGFEPDCARLLRNLVYLTIVIAAVGLEWIGKIEASATVTCWSV